MIKKIALSLSILASSINNVYALECYILDNKESVKLETVDDLFKIGEYMHKTHPLFTNKERYTELVRSLQILLNPEKRKNEDLDEFLDKNSRILISIAEDISKEIKCNSKTDVSKRDGSLSDEESEYEPLFKNIELNKSI